MTCGPLPEGTVASPTAAAVSTRRRARETPMLEAKRRYFAATGLRGAGRAWKKDCGEGGICLVSTFRRTSSLRGQGRAILMRVAERMRFRGKVRFFRAEQASG